MGFDGFDGFIKSKSGLDFLHNVGRIATALEKLAEAPPEDLMGQKDKCGVPGGTHDDAAMPSRTCQGCGSPLTNDNTFMYRHDNTCDLCSAKAEHAAQQALQARVVSIPFDDDGLTVMDPKTGNHHFQCVTCGMVGELEDSHSGGECNYCHAMGKDD